MWYWVLLSLFYQGVQAATVHQLGQGNSQSADGLPHIRSIASQGSKAQMTDFASMEVAALQASATSTQAFVKADSDPVTPQGYSLVFGPTNGATAASGFMGFTALATYDVLTCSQLCNARSADAIGGACKFFNIWQAVVNGTVGQTTCALYFTPTNASTATNLGSAQMTVSQSRGYARVSLLPDGGFEQLPPCAGGLSSCSVKGDATWTLVTTASESPSATASDLLRIGGAHSGAVYATIGFWDSTNTGIWKPANPINTVPGSRYVITLYHRLISDFGTSFGVVWNGAVVLSPVPVDFDWHYYEVQVDAIGDDVLEFKDDFRQNDGFATSAIDDIFVFLV